MCCFVADYQKSKNFFVGFLLSCIALSRIIISHDDDDEEDDKEEEVVSRRRKRIKARVNTRRTHQSKEKEEEEYVDSTGVTNYALIGGKPASSSPVRKIEKDFDANALHLKGRTTT